MPGNAIILISFNLKKIFNRIMVWPMWWLQPREISFCIKTHRNLVFNFNIYIPASIWKFQHTAFQNQTSCPDFWVGMHSLVYVIMFISSVVFYFFSDTQNFSALKKKSNTYALWFMHSVKWRNCHILHSFIISRTRFPNFVLTVIIVFFLSGRQAFVSRVSTFYWASH